MPESSTTPCTRSPRYCRPLLAMLAMLVVALIGTACGGASSDTTSTAAGFDQEAIAKAMQAGDCRTAMREADDALEQGLEGLDAVYAHVAAGSCAVLARDNAAAQKHVDYLLRYTADRSSEVNALGEYMQALLEFRSGDATAARTRLDALLEKPITTDVPQIGSGALILRSFIASQSGNCPSAIADARQSIALNGNRTTTDAVTAKIANALLGGSDDGSSARNEARAHMLIGSCSAYTGKPTVALEEARMSVAIAEQAGEPLLILETTAAQADTAQTAGDCKTALAAAQKTAEAAATIDSVPLKLEQTSTATAASVLCLVDAGQNAKALRLADSAVAEYEASGLQDPTIGTSLIAVQVGALIAAGKVNKGCTTIDQHPEFLTSPIVTTTPDGASFLSIASECLMLGDPTQADYAQARRLANRAVKVLQKAGNQDESLGFALYLRGLANVGMGRVSAARADIVRAAELGDENAKAILNG